MNYLKIETLFRWDSCTKAAPLGQVYQGSFTNAAENLINGYWKALLVKVEIGQMSGKTIHS